MKTILSGLLFIFFFSTGLSAQSESWPKNSIKYGYGTTFLDQGDFFGRMHYLEYNHSFFRHLGFGVNAGLTNALQTKADGFEQKTRAYQGDANLFLSILSNDVNQLKLGGGASYRAKEHNAYQRDTETGDIIEWIFEGLQEDNFGWTAAIEYEVFIAKHIILGSKGMYQQYQNGDKVYFWGLNIGVRF